MKLSNNELRVILKFSSIFILLCFLSSLVGLNEVWTFKLSAQPIVTIILIGTMAFAIGYSWNDSLAIHSTRKKLLQLLTTREKEILQLILDGKSNKEICSQLFIEQNTLKTHIKNIYKKTNCSKRDECINLFQ